MTKFSTYNFVVADRSLLATGGSFSFRVYTDRSGILGKGPGMAAIYDDGSKDRFGAPTGKAFTISQSHYNLQARDGQKSYNGIPLSEFFFNTPWTEGSPNGDYRDADGNPVLIDDLMKREENIRKIRSGELTQANVKFKLMDGEADARIAFEAGQRRAEAQISAGQIDDLTLQEMAALIGEYGAPDMTMRFKVYEFAGKKPIDYFKNLNRGDRAIRAIIRKGINDRVLTVKGTVIYWEETVLGADEDAVVATLLGDAKMLDALQQKVDFKNDTKKKKK
jgi:hypothetical protein